MAKNVFFLVHGVGHHPEGWAAADDGPINTLTTVANNYSGFSGESPLGNSVEFVEIRYDDIFDRILERWAELANGLADLPNVAPDQIRAVRNQLSEVNAPDNWFASEAMDVLFYIGFPLVRRLVLLRVASKIMQTIAGHEASDNRRYSILGHSLGTTVVHDAIHKMGTTNWLSPDENVLEILNANEIGEDVTLEDMARVRERYGDRIFSPGNFKFDAIFMISNTSALLQKSARNPYESIVRPRNSGGGPSSNACNRFYNVDHVLDPIGKVRRFRAAEAWPLAAGEHRTTAFDIFRVSHIHDVNVHGLDHYLKHPRVHAPILRSLARGRFSWDDFLQANARADEGGDFPQWGQNYQDEDFQDVVEGALNGLRVRGSREKLAVLLAAMPGVVSDVRSRIGQ